MSFPDGFIVHQISILCEEAYQVTLLHLFHSRAFNDPRKLTLYGHIKPQSTDQYTSIWWLVHWLLMGGLLHLVQRGEDWAGPQPAQAPPGCTKCNSQPINGQCTSFILFDVALSNCLWTL